MFQRPKVNDKDGCSMIFPSKHYDIDIDHVHLMCLEQSSTTALQKDEVESDHTVQQRKRLNLEIEPYL